jgi:hypothetical protein
MGFKKYVLAFVLILAACSQAPKEKPTWHESMRELSEVLSDLMPMLVLNRVDDSPATRQKIQALTLQLSKLTHGIGGDTAVPSQDASVKLMAREFKIEIQTIQKLMSENKWPQAQNHLRVATQYCLACHTTTASASSGYTFNLKSNLRGFSHYDKAVYYTAVRQFENALVEYEYALTDKKWAAEQPASWNKGIMGILAITTRVKNDPNLGTEMISRFFDSKTYPQDLAPAARVWRAHTVAWEREKTAEQSLGKVEGWLKEAEKLKATPQADLILSLRASSVLNELLRVGTLKGADLQKAYFYSGQLAARLADLNVSGFARDYYGLCVQQNAKTSWGKKCQAQLSAAQTKI